MTSNGTTYNTFFAQLHCLIYPKKFGLNSKSSCILLFPYECIWEKYFQCYFRRFEWALHAHSCRKSCSISFIYKTMQAVGYK